MKVSKKVLSMLLCGFIAFGSSQAATLVKADAAGVTSSVSQQGDEWRLGIRLKLRAKRNMLYKEFRQIDLVCNKYGHLRLEKTSTIPRNLTFDDTYYIGFNDNKNMRGRTRIPFKLDMNIGGNTDAILAQEIHDFNAADLEVGDIMFAHGKGWDGTLRFSSVNSPVKQSSNNDYAYGYKNRDRWQSGFRIKDDGLYEMKFVHNLPSPKYDNTLYY